MYSVSFTEKAAEQLRKLDRSIQERVGKALERIKIRPEHFVKRLTGLRYFSLRVGDYRVILDVLKGELIILVIKVGHRRNVYNNLNSR